MAEEKKIATGYIGNALRSSAADHTTTFTDEIFDTERQKYQNEVNTDLETTDNEIKADLEAETARAKAAEEAIIYDVSSHNEGKVFESLTALLSDVDLNTLIPATIRKGGMTISFIQSTDNKYVQYRLMAQRWSINPIDWQGVDTDVTYQSKNLIESGSVKTFIDNRLSNSPNIAVITDYGHYLDATGVRKADSTFNSSLILLENGHTYHFHQNSGTFVRIFSLVDTTYTQVTYFDRLTSYYEVPDEGVFYLQLVMLASSGDLDKNVWLSKDEKLDVYISPYTIEDVLSFSYKQTLSAEEKTTIIKNIGLVFETKPTIGSNNIITSGAVAKVIDKINLVNDYEYVGTRLDNNGDRIEDSNYNSTLIPLTSGKSYRIFQSHPNNVARIFKKVDDSFTQLYFKIGNYNHITVDEEGIYLQIVNDIRIPNYAIVWEDGNIYITENCVKAINKIQGQYAKSTNLAVITNRKSYISAQGKTTTSNTYDSSLIKVENGYTYYARSYSGTFIRVFKLSSGQYVQITSFAANGSGFTAYDVPNDGNEYYIQLVWLRADINKAIPAIYKEAPLDYDISAYSNYDIQSEIESLYEKADKLYEIDIVWGNDGFCIGNDGQEQSYSEIDTVRCSDYTELPNDFAVLKLYSSVITDTTSGNYMFLYDAEHVFITALYSSSIRKFDGTHIWDVCEAVISRNIIPNNAKYFRVVGDSSKVVDTRMWAETSNYQNPYRNSWVFGKKIAVFGGSFSIYSQSDAAKNMWKLMLNCGIENYGMPGNGYSNLQTPTDNVQVQVDRAIAAKTTASVFILWLSTNDFNNNRPMGVYTDYTSEDSYDVTKLDTQCGGINYAIKTIYEYNPNAKIVAFAALKAFIKEDAFWNPYSITTNTTGKTFKEYMDEARKCFAYYGIPVLEQSDIMDVNIFNKSSFYMSDNLHPNMLAYRRIACKQIEFLAEL